MTHIEVEIEGRTPLLIHRFTAGPNLNQKEQAMMMKVWAVGYAVTFVLVTTGHERHWLVGTLVVLATVVGGLWAEDKWGEKNHE